MYRRSVSLYKISRYTKKDSIDSSCIGILRAMYCYYQFPYCKQNPKNFTWTEKGICKSLCTLYKIRCKAVNIFKLVCHR